MTSKRWRWTALASAGVAALAVGSGATSSHQVDTSPGRNAKEVRFSPRAAGATDADRRAGAELAALAGPRVAFGPTVYFAGTPQDQANKLAGPPYTATFASAKPTGSTPITQSTSPLASSATPDDPLAAFWTGPFTGAVDGTMQLTWYWGTPNGEAAVIGDQIDVSVFADPDFTAHTGTLIGTATVGLSNLTPAPTLEINQVPVKGTITHDLLIQAVPHFIDSGNGLQAFYGSASTASAFSISDGPVTGDPPPTVSFARTAANFGPATVVSAHLLGGEPQGTIIHPAPDGRTAPGLDPKRVFIDWPYTSSTQTDILTRSTDGGNSFRLLVDPQCPQRNRPNCATGGGGDSEDEVNLQTGTVLFADQQGVAAEAVSSSTDGGDSFPVGRQFAVTAPVTGVDRQWLASAGKAIFKSATGSPIEALYSYHIPAVGEYIVGIDDTGKPVPQPAPQLTGVSQSGQMRIDTGSGPARGWVYVPFITSAGYQVGTVEGKNYADPTKWKVSGVSSDGPDIFPWIALDKVGNAYAVWSSGGVAWYSFSAIADPANNPAAGGRPATHWSTKVAVSLPTMRSAVFPEVTAGDDGRVAITYDATSAPGADDKPYAPDLAPETAPWDAYVVILTNATATGGSPIAATFSTVSHRHVHVGTVCTSGTTCTGDRSLLDLTDVGYDSDGRVSVIYTDNNSGFQLSSSTVDNDPFVLFAKQVSGPSLLTTSPRVKVFVPKGHTTDATGDAKGVNVAAGISLPSLDLGAASLSEGRNPATGRDEVTATFTLADASAARMTSDLAAYNTANPLLAPAQRLQYIARFSTSTDIYHLSFEQLADGTRRAFAGKLDANDGLFVANATAIAGAAYHTDAAMPVTFRVDGTTVTLVIDAAAIGIPDGTPIYSATIFATAGPTEANEKTVVNSMRTVDATPAFDGRL